MAVMKHRIRSAALFYLLVLMASAGSRAQAVSLSGITVETAPAAKARAKEIREAAQIRFKTEKADCNTRMINVGCMSAAEDRRAASIHEAEALQKEAARVEREARQAKIAEKEAQRAAKAHDEESGRLGAEANHREKEAQRVLERERRQTDEQSKLETRRGSAAAEREEKLRKIEEYRREDAARAAGAPERAGKRVERERKQAERVKKIDERKRDYAEMLKRREADKAAAEAKAAAAAAKK